METPINQEKTQLEAELQAIRESTARAKEEIEQAEAQLKLLEGEREPFYKNKTLQTTALATGVVIGGAIGSGYLGKMAIDRIGQEQDHYSALELKEKKATPPEQTNIYSAPAEMNLTNKVAELAKTNLPLVEVIAPPEVTSTPEPAPETKKSIVEVEQENQEKLRRAQEESDRKLAQKQAEIERIKQRLADAEAAKQRLAPTPGHIQSRTPEIREDRYGSGVWDKPRPITTAPIREDVYGGGAWTRSGVPISPDVRYQPPREMPADNPPRLSEKMEEEINDVYEQNLIKVFPTDTLRTWRNIKDKGAYEFMNRPENKVKKEHKLLKDYLENLKAVTGLEPKSGVRGKTESIEAYMDRALRYAASKKLLDQFK